jgi:hypothetical protein
LRTSIHTLGIAIALSALVAACAPQSGPSTAGPASMPGHNMGAMSGQSMSAADHQAMMTHCAQMRQSVQQGARLSPNMQQMMTQCDQMDRSMGSQRTR